MTTQLAPQPVFQAFASNGAFLVGGKLFTYVAGTTTPQATYIDATLTTQNTNPVILNAMGQAPVWLNPLLAYKFVLTDAVGNAYWTTDNINGTTNLNFTFNGGPFDGTTTDVYFHRIAAYVGGTNGFVNTALTVQTDVTGTNVASDEWPLLARLNNFADGAFGSENVPAYLQGNKYGTAATWGGVIEVIERTAVNNPPFGTIALEIDVSVNGTDNSGAGNRVGVDLVIRRFNPAGAAAQANWGYRIDSSDTGATVGFGFGYFPGSTANIGFDASQAAINIAAFQLAQGQAIIFDGPNTQLNKFVNQGLGLDYIVSGVLQTRLMKTGGFQVQGNQVIGPRIGGYGTPTGGSRATLVPGTATLAQVCALLNQVIVDFETHGALGT